ncbi:MAG TPA: histidine--tRNA ligase, partial [Anaerolineae bacterium]|nr:histidine--tRNA ligase [Anaerolineae bacterium]
ESTSLYIRGVGEGTDIVDKEMYSFRDRGGDELTLRPEFTAGIMRAYIEHGMHVWPPPVKLFSIGPIFRFERPQAGRYRQHHQFNVEAIGIQDASIDVEVMSVAWALFTQLGFQDLSFQINSTGCPDCRPSYIKVLVDYYNQHYNEIDDDCKRRLERNPLRVLDCKADQCQPVIAGAPKISDYLCDDCASHFADLQKYLDALGRPYMINHRLVRGLDYYTKTVFEVHAAGIGAQSAVCGGGRYDGLIEELGGSCTPGIGFGSGIERIIMTLKLQGIQPPPLPQPRVMVSHHGETARIEAVKLAELLREHDIGVLLPYRNTLKAQLKQADRLRVAFTLILGEEELASDQVTVRNMVDSTQQLVPRDDIVGWLQVRL